MNASTILRQIRVQQARATSLGHNPTHVLMSKSSHNRLRRYLGVTFYEKYLSRERICKLFNLDVIIADVRDCVIVMELPQ